VAESEEDAPTAPRPAKARRRKARTVPFDHKVGVTQFGRLTLVDGTVLLCETRLFHGHADGVEAVLVELIGGATRIVAGDGSLTWQAIEADAACDEAGLPHPEMLKHEDLARRLDPHHVERHANPLWRALVELVVARKLPCGFSLSALAADREVKRFEDAAAEDPGVFAAAVCERIARGAERDEAIVAELAGDARVAPEDIGPLLDETGWTEALAALPALLDAWRIVLPARMVTLTQPWASLVANGHKRHETRSLTTTWRGPLVIHAAKGFPADLPRGFCAELCRRPEFAAALDGRQLDDLPLGSVVALGMLTEVAPTAETDADVLAREGAFGDYGPGRYAWAVADVEPIEPAIPCSGARGLRRLPADVQRALAEHLAAKAGSPC
jgi:hypothetical protein